MLKEIIEGKTRLLVPEPGKYGVTKKGRERKPPVFYNPRMKLNRDICCSVVKVLARNESINFADVLAGSGARGIRVANEVGCSVHLNDASREAFQLIKKNANLNNLKVQISNKDANLFLQEEGRFNFIDIDPFGTPVPFLDNAIMRLEDFGYLGITATDTAPLCGVYPKACFRKYGALPLRSDFCHEVGFRILIGYTARAAARYNKGLRCVLGHSTDHYFRIYVQLCEGKKKANEALRNLGYVYYCGKCLKRESSKGFFPQNGVCECGNTYNIAGPLWLGEIRDREFTSLVLEESHYLEDKRVENLLQLINSEVEVPFYYDIHRLCKSLKVNVPPFRDLISKLKDEGYTASRTHFALTAIKTDAPLDRLKLLL